MHSWAKKFDTIYIEKEVLSHPKTQDILKKFPNSLVVEIEFYKDVFHKFGQIFQVQKNSPKLILAKKKDNYLYDGSPYAPNFQHPHFYYNTLVMNCLYNCDYCYLQGMYSSAHVVVFVNQEDFFHETDQALERLGSLYLCISYDTDLLGFESILGFCKDWIEFAKTRPQLLVELRTKSAGFSHLQSTPAIPNLILAWTLSPESIVSEFESLTPSVETRILQIQKALELGWRVRICFDPILHTPQWKKDYQKLVETLANKLNLSQIEEFSMGAFRIQKDYLKSMKKGGQTSSVVHYPFEVKDGIASYPTPIQKEMESYLLELLTDHIPTDRIQFLKVEPA